MGIWVLSIGVVSPNDNVVNVVDVSAHLVGKLAVGAVLIEAGESGEVRLRDRGSVVGADECVGVCWVANNSDLDSLLRNLVDGFTLRLEDLRVGGEEISTFHSWSSWSGTDHDDDVGVLECNESIGCWDDVSDAWVCTVLQFHDEALEDFLCRGQLEKLQNDFLVGSEHATDGNELQQL